MAELYLPLCGAVFSLLLCIVFFSKKRLWLVENKVYGVMIVAGFLDSLIVSIERILVIDGKLSSVSPVINAILTITNKLDMGVLIVFVTGAFLYTLLITYPKTKDEFGKWLKITALIDSIIYFIVLILDVKFIESNNIVSVQGGAFVVTYLFGSIYLIISMLMALFNFKRLTTKHIPIITTIFISIFLIIVFATNPYVMIISVTITFVMYIMFFTIENPDLQLIDELGKSKELAEKYNNDKSKFVFNMTQQIRYPLNKIEQASQKIKEEKKIELIKEDNEEINVAAKTISNIINGALNISSIDAKKVKIVENKYNIKNLIQEVSLKTESLATTKNLEFIKNIDEGLPSELYGDSIRLKQVVYSALENAIKHTEKGFVELDINYIIKYDVCRIIFSIRDSGVGISSNQLDKLLESKDESLDENSELLTLKEIKKVVNLIGGTMTVETEKSRGTEISIIVDQRIKKEESNVTEIVEQYQKINNKKAVLFISDKEDELNFYKKKLSNIYIVETSLGGENALKRMRNNEVFDVVIVKEEMDKLDGIKVLEKIEQLEENKPPVILFTERKDSIELSRYKEMGFKAVIFNDFTNKQLVEKINGVFD